MSRHQFSMEYYWRMQAEKISPALSWNEEWDFAEWKKASGAKLRELIGDFPKRVPLMPDVEYSVEEEDFIRQRVVFDSEEEMSVPCQVLIPKGEQPQGGFPAILCCHGHGKFGKDPVAGLAGTPECRADIAEMNYDYGAQMAKAGFLTICPDLRGFGERRDGDDWLGRDTCNVNLLKGEILGKYPLALNIWDMKCCIDYLCTRKDVNPQRIGMMGLSMGGTMTAFTTAVEPRIKAADIIAYINPWDRFGIARGNFCGSQILPGLRCHLDTSDIAGLIAPRPLLLEMGTGDRCFFFQDLWKGYESVKNIYENAGAGDQLWKDIHSGGHAFSGKKAAAFFRQYL